MYVVIGANGYIGSYIIKNILENTNDDILAVGRNVNEEDVSNGRIKWTKCDITNENDVECLAHSIIHQVEVKVIYLAAYHHPDEVKKNPKMAWDVNITSLSRVLNTLENVACLFYVSTEMVYGEGSIDRKFKETDDLNPVNLYGIQKKVAESLVLGYGYNVVRFPFVIGPSLLSEKKHFFDVIVETIKSGNVMEMFEDAYKSALDFNTATELVVRLTEMYSEDVPKILNISGDEVLSKYDIGLAIARAYKLDEKLIRPIRLKQDNGIFDEKRAGCTLLDNSLLKEVLHIETIRMKF